jgi:hypothetical protein
MPFPPSRVATSHITTAASPSPANYHEPTIFAPVFTTAPKIAREPSVPVPASEKVVRTFGAGCFGPVYLTLGITKPFNVLPFYLNGLPYHKKPPGSNKITSQVIALSWKGIKAFEGRIYNMVEGLGNMRISIATASDDSFHAVKGWVIAAWRAAKGYSSLLADQAHYGLWVLYEMLVFTAARFSVLVLAWALYQALLLLKNPGLWIIARVRHLSSIFRSAFSTGNVERLEQARSQIFEKCRLWWCEITANASTVGPDLWDVIWQTLQVLFWALLACAILLFRALVWLISTIWLHRPYQAATTEAWNELGIIKTGFVQAAFDAQNLPSEDLKSPPKQAAIISSKLDQKLFLPQVKVEVDTSVFQIEHLRNFDPFSRKLNRKMQRTPQHICDCTCDVCEGLASYYSKHNIDCTWTSPQDQVVEDSGYVSEHSSESQISVPEPIVVHEELLSSVDAPEALSSNDNATCVASVQETSVDKSPVSSPITVPDCHIPSLTDGQDHSTNAYIETSNIVALENTSSNPATVSNEDRPIFTGSHHVSGFNEADSCPIIISDANSSKKITADSNGVSSTADVKDVSDNSDVYLSSCPVDLPDYTSDDEASGVSVGKDATSPTLPTPSALEYDPRAPQLAILNASNPPRGLTSSASARNSPAHATGSANIPNAPLVLPAPVLLPKVFPRTAFTAPVFTPQFVPRLSASSTFGDSMGGDQGATDSGDMVICDPKEMKAIGTHSGTHNRLNPPPSPFSHAYQPPPAFGGNSQSSPAEAGPGWLYPGALSASSSMPHSNLVPQPLKEVEMDGTDLPQPPPTNPDAMSFTFSVRPTTSAVPLLTTISQPSRDVDMESATAPIVRQFGNSVAMAPNSAFTFGAHAGPSTALSFGNPVLGQQHASGISAPGYMFGAQGGSSTAPQFTCFTTGQQQLLSSTAGPGAPACAFGPQGGSSSALQFNFGTPGKQQAHSFGGETGAPGTSSFFSNKQNQSAPHTTPDGTGTSLGPSLRDYFGTPSPFAAASGAPSSFPIVNSDNTHFPRAAPSPARPGTVRPQVPRGLPTSTFKPNQPSKLSDTTVANTAREYVVKVSRPREGMKISVHPKWSGMKTSVHSKWCHDSIGITPVAIYIKQTGAGDLVSFMFAELEHAKKLLEFAVKPIFSSYLDDQDVDDGRAPEPLRPLLTPTSTRIKKPWRGTPAPAKYTRNDDEDEHKMQTGSQTTDQPNTTAVLFYVKVRGMNSDWDADDVLARVAELTKDKQALGCFIKVEEANECVAYITFGTQYHAQSYKMAANQEKGEWPRPRASFLDHLPSERS